MPTFSKAHTVPFASAIRIIIITTRKGCTLPYGPMGV
jgi:hypothetical protein